MDYRTPSDEPEKNELEASAAIEAAIEASRQANAATRPSSAWMWFTRIFKFSLAVTVVVGFWLGSKGSHEAMLVGTFALILLLMTGLAGLMNDIPPSDGAKETSGVRSELHR